MKIFKKVTLISIMILYVLSIKSFADTGKINIEATRLRKEKNTTSEILTVIYENDEVEILENDGEWLKVKFKEYTGFVKKQYVDIKNSTNNLSNNTENENNASNKTTSVYSNGENAQTNSNSMIILKVTSKLRLQPNFMSKQTEEIAQGTNLRVLQKIGKWLQVTDETVTGWITDIKAASNENTPNVSTLDIDSTEDNTTNEVNNTVSNTDNMTNNTATNQTSSDSASISKKGKINVETAKVRKEPTTSSEVVDFLDYDDEVSISKESGDWYYVTHEKIEGYVNKTLITIINDTVSSRSLTEERKNDENIEENKSNEENPTSTVTSNQIVDFAKQYLGYPYVVGGKTPETGFDCSGFTRYVFKNFGYSLASVAAEQTNIGSEVTRENLQPGDLILFYNEEKTKIGHTGIYIGNGDFIHSANPERGVVIDNINTSSYYNQRFVTARRITE